MLTTFDILRLMILFGYMYHHYNSKTHEYLWMVYYIIVVIAYLIAFLIHFGVFTKADSKALNENKQIPVIYDLLTFELIAIPLVLLYEFYSMKKLSLKEESMKLRSIKAIQERDDKFTEALAMAQE